MKKEYDIVAISEEKQTWDTFFSSMRKSRTWVEGPVAQCTSWLLERDIVVVSQTYTISNPYLFIDGKTNDTINYPSIILGNVAGVHYQSFLPSCEAATKNISYQADIGSFIDVTSTPTKKVRLEIPKTPKVRPFKDQIQSQNVKERHRNFAGFNCRTHGSNSIRLLSKTFNSTEQEFSMMIGEYRKLHATVMKLRSHIKILQGEGRDELQEEKENVEDTHLLLDDSEDDSISDADLSLTIQM